MTRKTNGGKGDRIPGADPAAYAKGYEGIDWNARERGKRVLAPSPWPGLPMGDQPIRSIWTRQAEVEPLNEDQGREHG